MKSFSLSVLLIGDKYISGVKNDNIGKSIVNALVSDDFILKDYSVVSDDANNIREVIISHTDEHPVDLIITVGGTGLTPTDITPEVTRRLIDKEVPGLSEAMRFEGYRITNKALLSRGICGIRRKTLIINLPGSSKGAMQSLKIIRDILPHAIKTIHRI